MAKMLKSLGRSKLTAGSIHLVQLMGTIMELSWASVQVHIVLLKLPQLLMVIKVLPGKSGNIWCFIYKFVDQVTAGGQFISSGISTMKG